MANKTLREIRDRLVSPLVARLELLERRLREVALQARARAIRSFRPRAVVIECNASLGRTARIVQPYDPGFCWDHTSASGANLAALEALGQERGYALVGCDAVGANAFFVRQDLLGDRFQSPFTAERHYQPPRYGPSSAGHPPRWAPFVEV